MQRLSWKMILKNCRKDRSDPDEVFSNKKIIDIVRVLHHEVYEHEQIDEVCEKRDNDKFYTFTESDFNCVIWERVHDSQLGIKSYKMRINISALTITYPDIEKDPLYSIIGVPYVGIVCENNKKDKRAMDIDELQKFSDASLKRVLRKISVINVEAKHDLVKISLRAQDKDLMTLLEEEIEVSSSDEKMGKFHEWETNY
ncbi:hypothetical protein Tco_0284989 [Tanacetum coccineum]